MPFADDVDRYRPAAQEHLRRERLARDAQDVRDRARSAVHPAQAAGEVLLREVLDHLRSSRVSPNRLYYVRPSYRLFSGPRRLSDRGWPLANVVLLDRDAVRLVPARSPDSGDPGLRRGPDPGFVGRIRVDQDLPSHVWEGQILDWPRSPGNYSRTHRVRSTHIWRGHAGRVHPFDEPLIEACRVQTPGGPDDSSVIPVHVPLREWLASEVSHLEASG